MFAKTKHNKIWIFNWIFKFSWKYSSIMTDNYLGLFIKYIMKLFESKFIKQTPYEKTENYWKNYILKFIYYETWSLKILNIFSPNLNKIKQIGRIF